jgi:PRMT5 arginine-N-methyltransferase/ribosomal protein L11 methyltransferase PrmA
VYSLAAYGEMIRDRDRMEAYAGALRRAVRPGAVVLDIGTGTGIMACLACAYGAGRVYALEPAEVIEAARAVARANGFADRIEFIQKPSTAVTLPVPADVIVSDLRGVLPLFQQHVPSIVDARRRLLAAEGALIPRRDVIHAAIASAPNLHAGYLVPWERNEYRLDMKAVSRLETNAWRQCRARAEHLGSTPKPLATLDYKKIEHADLAASVTFDVDRTMSAHGLLVWFDTELDEERGFSNAPGAPPLIYGQAFFPWPREVALDVGDTVSVVVQATLIGDDYVWTWMTRLGDARGGTRAKFRQSTFLAVPRSPAMLRRRSAAHVASLNEEGRVDRLVLELFAHEMTLDRIAAEVFAKFSGRFRTLELALAHVADLSVRYSDGPR